MLVQVALGRRMEDDRDHYANKRLDLGGPLLAGLFRNLFRKVVNDVRGAVQRAVDKGERYTCNILERAATSLSQRAHVIARTVSHAPCFMSFHRLTECGFSAMDVNGLLAMRGRYRRRQNSYHVWCLLLARQA